MSKCFNKLLFALSVGLASSVQAAAPTITSFTPGAGKLSTSVTITGTGFASPATVTFDGVASTSVTVNSSTSLVALVPLTAATGTIAVTDSGGSVTSSNAFTVYPGDITSFANTNPGTTGLIYFSGFDAFEAVDFYFDTTDIALAITSSAGAGNASATIPASATPGTHWISAVGQHSGLAAQFSYLVRTDWAQLDFRPNHRGRNPFETVLSTSTVSQLEEVWRTPDFNGTYSTPADVGGIIYQTFFDGTVRAFNEISGAQVWTYQTNGYGDDAYSSPAVVNGVVYVGGAGSYMYALTASTGALKWRYATGGTVSSPVVKNGIVYFGSADDNLYALNASTGALVWKYGVGGAISSSPAIWNGMVYFGSHDYNVYALNAATGALVWTLSTTSDVAAPPTVVDGTVYIGSDDAYMYAINAQNGTLRWSFETGSSIEGGAAVGNGTVYFGSFDQKVYAVNGATGKLTWSFASPVAVALTTNACLANGVLYICDEFSTYALDASSGYLEAALPPSPGFGGPIAVNGALLVTDNYSGVLVRYALNAAANETPSAAPDPAKLRHHPLR